MAMEYGVSLLSNGKRLRDFLSLGAVVGLETSGREVHSAECKICGIKLRNERSGYRHLRNIHFMEAVEGLTHLDSYFKIEKKGDAAACQCGSATDDKEDQEKETAGKPSIVDSQEVTMVRSCLTEKDRRMIRAVVDGGVAIDSLKRDAWKKFAETLGLRIPSRERIRLMIVTYGDEILAKNFASMRGRYATLITDGGTIIGKQFYPVIMFCERRLYFIDAIRIDQSTHTAIASSLAYWVTKMRNDGIHVTSLITDNAKNITLATRDASQQGPGMTTVTQLTSVQQLTGLKMLHISCGVHSANLALRDYETASIEFKKFTAGVSALFKWLREKPVRVYLKKKGVATKVPSIMPIKWLCYYHAFSFLTEYQSQVNDAMSELSVPRNIGFTVIPDEWVQYLTFLKPIGEFIIRVEGNDVVLSEFYVAYRQLLDRLADFKDMRATALANLLKKRMMDTCDIGLAQLAYLFTTDGFSEYQRVLKPLEQYANGVQATAHELYRQLRSKMIQLCKNMGTDDANRDIGPMFHAFVMQYNWSDEPFVVQMQTLRSSELAIGNRRVPWGKFTDAAVKLSQFPASESAAERVLSVLTKHFSLDRSAMKDDLFSAEARISVQENLDNYNKSIVMGRTLDA